MRIYFVMKKRNSTIRLIITLLICFSANYFAQGFLHRVDKKIYNGSGQEVLLKGIGLGGWLVQEGYMLQTSAFANAQWQIRSKISALIGETNTETFYQAFRDNYIKKADINSLKKYKELC